MKKNESCGTGFLTLITLCAFAFSVLATGCKHVARETPADPTAPKPHIRHNTRIYIGTPVDATYKGDTVLDSGRLTAEALKSAFTKVSGSVFGSRNTESFVDALERARATRSELMIYPTILAWEDHPTEWNAVPDKLEVQLQIVDVATAGMLYKTTLRARSKIMTDGGDKPEQLLPDLFNRFAESLLKAEQTPSALR